MAGRVVGATTAREQRWSSEGKTALGRKCTNQPPRAGSRAADDVTEGCL